MERRGGLAEGVGDVSFEICGNGGRIELRRIEMKRDECVSTRSVWRRGRGEGRGRGGARGHDVYLDASEWWGVADVRR